MTLIIDIATREKVLSDHHSIYDPVEHQVGGFVNRDALAIARSEPT
jgi:hypothetical protein